MSLSQGIRSSEPCIGDGVVAAVHVDGNNLPVMGRFNPWPDMPLVDLFAEAFRFLDSPMG